MNTLYWLITITDRHSTDAFLALYEEHGITVSLRTVGAGTAVRETLSTLGLEQTEKAVLFAMITAETWPGLQKTCAVKCASMCRAPASRSSFRSAASAASGRCNS